MDYETGLAGKKVLIVDDDSSVIKGLLESLKGENCTVDQAGDGLEAFEKIASEDYDLIISDVMMPGLNGQKLYKYMSEVKPYLIHRCILITGAMNDQLEAFCKSVNLPYLNKPFSSSDLKKLISILLVKKEKNTPSV